MKGMIVVKNYISFKAEMVSLPKDLVVFVADPEVAELIQKEGIFIAGKGELGENRYHPTTVQKIAESGMGNIFVHTNKTSDYRLPEKSIHQIDSFEFNGGRPSYIVKPRVFIQEGLPKLRPAPDIVDDRAVLHRSLRNDGDMGLTIRSKGGFYKNYIVRGGGNLYTGGGLDLLFNRVKASSVDSSLIKDLSTKRVRGDNILTKGIEKGSVASLDLVSMEVKGEKESLADLSACGWEDSLCDSIAIKIDSAERAQVNRVSKSLSAERVKYGWDDIDALNPKYQAGAYSYTTKVKPDKLTFKGELSEFTID